MGGGAWAGAEGHPGRREARGVGTRARGGFPDALYAEIVFVALNSRLRRHGRRLALVGAVLALGTAVAGAHGGMGDDHMGEAVAICMAVTVAATTLGALPRLGRWLAALPRRVVHLGVPAPAWHPVTAEARARPGPVVLQVFRC